MDKSCIKVAGKWKWFYRAPLIALETRLIFCSLPSEIRPPLDAFWRVPSPYLHGVLDTITTNKSGASTVALERVKADAFVDIVMRPNKYLNNPCDVSSPSRQKNHLTDARVSISSGALDASSQDSETRRMIRKGQMDGLAGQPMSAAQQFYRLAV